MIKKSILAFFTFVLVIVPFFVFAKEAGLADCCQLSHNIILKDVTVVGVIYESYQFETGQIVGEGDGKPTTINQCQKGDIDIETPDWAQVCLLNTIYNITDLVFYFILSISIILAVVSAFFLLTSGGEPAKLEKSKGMLFWIIAGLVVAFLAKVIPAIIRTVV